MNSLFNQSILNNDNIYDDSSLMNNHSNNELNLFEHEESEISNNNFCLSSNQNLIEDINDNMEENGAAPLISNNNDHSNDFGNFSFLNDSNIQGVKIDYINNDNMDIEPNIIEEKENEKENNNEFKEYNFQKGDFITPLGDNDNNCENSNNLNSKSIILTTSSIIVNTFETPLNSKSNKKNLENSSSSQSTNKSSILNTPQSYSQLNNISNETLSPQKETEEKPTNTPKKRKRKNSKSKTKLSSHSTNSRNRFKLEGIRKKIKSRLLKKLKTFYNKKLLEANSQMFFDFFPQSFITDVSIINNKSYLNLTMRNLLTKIFGTRAKDKEKLSINKKVLNYLDANPDIRIKSGIDNFLNSYYKDVIKEYVEGDLFKEDIIKLRQESESEEYIQKYIDLAKNLVEFYESNGMMKIKTKS